MSRSKRKTPIMGWTKAESEKEDKRNANRALRRSVKMQIDSASDFDSLVVDSINDVSSVWSFDKDGKSYFGDSLRLTPEEIQKYMRK